MLKFLKMEGVKLKLMREDDIKHVIQWTHDEKWPTTELDLRVFLTCYPEDYFVAEIDGQPVGKYKNW